MTPSPSGPGQPRTKHEWRAYLRARRRAVPPELRAAEATQLVETAVRSAAGCAGPVCCYSPIADEPGSPALLDALRAAGHVVLLPLVPHDGGAGAPVGRPLNWAPYEGADQLVDGPYGIKQPRDAGWGPAAIATAGFVLVPALAVDQRGVRLGRGAGWYDRTLPLARPHTPLVAVVRDDDIVRSLPADRHDVRMTDVLTPRGGLRALPLSLD
ncbi:MAG TPA: 5-formyltetrahydrofolate cyclo-ligase [Pseudonocardia sp.]|jgi:5-formyltetrahydrofolate cyclo-ligase